MKVSYVKFREPVRIIMNGTNINNTYINSERLDIELIDNSHFLVYSKGPEAKLLALIPFSNCAYCYPNEIDSAVPLEDVAEKIDGVEQADDPTMRFAVPLKKPENKSKHGSNKGATT